MRTAKELIGAFDTIGNRTQTEAGGDQTGANLRLARYTNNVLNQITSRDVPGDVDVMGLLLASNTVTVNSNTPYRRGEYFREQLAVTNTSAAVWTNITVASPGQSSVSGHVYVARTPETNTYDLDGNLLSDGRWTYSWDAENRLTNMTSLSGAPSGSQLNLSFVYDYMGRRIQKVVSTNSGLGYVVEYTDNYAYDGWNCVAVLNSSLSLVNSFLWGTDLSGSMQGAGGVGGLVQVTYYGSSPTNGFVAYDGNGNVVALVNAADGSTLSLYEYGPFGELIRATGPMAKLNPFRFSTKYDDDESDFLYYGYRYYNPSTGRWLSRDPKEECGFKALKGADSFPSPDPTLNPELPSLYSLLGNSQLNGIDLLGLCGGGGSLSMCGRDVTIDITLTKITIRRTWDYASWWQHYEAGLEMFVPPMAFKSWDIDWIDKNSDFGGTSPACANTVTFQGYCVLKNELNFIMYGWGAVLDGVNYKGTFNDLRDGLWTRHFLLGIDTPTSIRRKIGFARLGAGDRTMGADLAAPGGCSPDNGDIYPAMITEWHWDGLKD
jgi:RHS repeat-associated protein